MLKAVCVVGATLGITDSFTEGMTVGVAEGCVIGATLGKNYVTTEGVIVGVAGLCCRRDTGNN